MTSIYLVNLVFTLAYVWIIVPVRNHFAIASTLGWLRSRIVRIVS